MWKNVSKEVLDKEQYIVPLKKGELQIKYAEALVKIDKAIEYIKDCEDIYIKEDLLKILEDKDV